MKIYIWLEELGMSLSDLDSTFNWETNYIPLVGDDVTYEVLGKGKFLPIDGTVIRRTFYVVEDTVSLDLSISDDDVNRISNYLDEIRGKVEDE